MRRLKSIAETLTKKLTDHFKSTGVQRLVLGLSGGIDSSLVLKLAVNAIGAPLCTAVSMPQDHVSSDESVLFAKNICEELDVELYSVPIGPMVDPFKRFPWSPTGFKEQDLSTQNTQSRMRAVILYHYANTRSALVLGTSNRSEILLGYGTKYGDLAADLYVIGDLYKTEVYTLSEYLGIPKEIIEKPPSGELYPGQTDEQDLGATYAELDPILFRLHEGEEELVKKFDPSLVRSVLDRVAKNRHKSVFPPILTCR